MTERKKRVDEDWKRQAEEEKKKISAHGGGRFAHGAPPSSAAASPAVGASSAAGAAAGPDSGADRARGVESGAQPDGSAESSSASPGAASTAGATGRVSLLSLVEQLAAQAMAALGQLPDPHTGQRYYDPELARDAIDMLGVLHDKTRGNLTPDEARAMTEILHSVRLLFARVGRAAAQQVGAAARAPGGGAEPAAP